MTDAVQMELRSFEGHNRLLVVFAKDENDAQLKQQHTLIRDHEKAMSERDVRLFTVLGDAAPAAGGSPEDWRRTLEVDGDGFAAVLIGKDGTEKTRWDAPVSWTELEQRIDAMPMRQAEAAEQGGV